MKMFIIAFDEKNLYLISAKTKKEAIEKAKRELLSGYGKIWSLKEVKPAKNIVENDIQTENVRIIKAKRWWLGNPNSNSNEKNEM
jgi:hypothetical protein